MTLARAILGRLRAFGSSPRLPSGARLAAAADRAGPPARSVKPKAIIDGVIGWLARAQDNSASADGGVARHYSLVSGWSPSYPETTGYIIPTFLTYAERQSRPDIAERAKRMLDWLVSIQFADGGFQGSVIGASRVVPVIFNTGQILLGLAAGERTFGRYGEPLRRAADWLTAVQDPDGCWRRHASPFTRPGDKTYDVHVAWGLVEAARVIPGRGYDAAALANLRWALGRQHDNGWFEDCCLTDPCQPLTHTLGYALRGLLEGYLFFDNPALLDATRRAADGLITALHDDGKLPGRLDSAWRSTVDWACLTGSSQIAHCWLQLYRITGDEAYREAASRALAWVRRTVALDGPDETRGGVKGSFPIDGGYGPFEFLNWAAKFTVDANLLELELFPGSAEPGR